MKNGKVKLQLPDCKSGCVPSGITNATQRGDIVVPKGYDFNLIKSSIEFHNPFVSVNFIIK